MSDNDHDKGQLIEPDEAAQPNEEASAQEARPLASLFADENLDEKLSAAAKKEHDPEKIALYKKYGAIGGTVLIILLLVYSLYSCQPKQGSMAYGVCSTLLEMNTQYPNTLRHINVEGSSTTVRIYYTSTDAFGQYKMEMFECKFGPDANGNQQIVDVLRNRDSMGHEFIDNANKILSTIVSSDPYRVMPPEWKNQLLKE